MRSLALPLIFVTATAYHFLQSRGHATPTVFNDELLYAKLSQAIAAGHGLAIRGEHFFFPAPLAPFELRVDVPNSPLGGRVLGVKVRALRFLDPSH